MKIINTIKKYFQNNNETVNLALTSTDNVFDKLDGVMLDSKLYGLEQRIKAMENTLMVNDYSISENDNFNTTDVKLCIIGNTVNIFGRLVPKATLNGEYTLQLPTNLKPHSWDVTTPYHFIVNGNEHKALLRIRRDNPTTLLMHFYDEVPIGEHIPVNITYVLAQTV